MNSRIPVLAVSVIAIVAAGPARPDDASLNAHAQQGGLGSVEFPTSGSREAQPFFLRGVAALHNFEYPEAVEAFRRARQIDPGFALAYWGEALAHHSTLDPSPDLTAARAVLRQLGPTPEARLARAPSEKEKGFFVALEHLFGDGDRPARQRAHVAAMARLHDRFPDDNEVASFYALALLDAAIRQNFGLDGAAEAHHGDAASGFGRTLLAGSDTQIRVGQILRKVLQRNPNHPGAAHYLLHNYDDAEHASLAADVARTYARIAPASSHAQHMPAHIFVQLGLWEEAAASDEAAVRASEAATPDEARRDYHPLTWLQYELLQLGHHDRARALLQRMEGVATRTGATLLKQHAASMRARYVVETGRWELLREGDDFGNLDELVAIGISAARSGNLERADQVRELLTGLAASERNRAFKPALIVMERQVAGLLYLAGGRQDDAVAALREAVDAEQRLPTGMGPPRPIKPARELLGEVFLEIGRLADARAQFEAASKRHPNRAATRLGLARAAAAPLDGTNATGAVLARLRHRRFTVGLTAAVAVGVIVMLRRRFARRPGGGKKKRRSTAR